MRRRGRSNRIFWFALMVIGSSVFAGGVAAWVTHFNLSAPNAPGTTAAAPAVASPSGLTPNTRNLGKLDRPQLEAEVTRLNQTVSERNAQIDELKIQLKLATEGSRAAQ